MTGLTFQRPPYTQLNGPEIQHFIENDLRYAVARLVELPRPDPLQVSPWVGDERVAEGYPTRPVQRCASLLRDAHNRLWRRIGCVAAEDIGLDNLDAVGVATAALAGKQLRSKMSWDCAVACAVILQLSRAPKCRPADDLLMVCELHPAYAKQHLPVAELTSIVCGVSCAIDCTHPLQACRNWRDWRRMSPARSLGALSARREPSLLLAD